MGSESEASSANSSPSAHQCGTDGEDLVFAALGILRGLHEAGGSSSWSPTLAKQKKVLREWADRLGLLLGASDLPSKVVRGGQEHELFHDEETDRYIKVTRNGVFGQVFGIELLGEIEIWVGLI